MKNFKATLAYLGLNAKKEIAFYAIVMAVLLAAVAAWALFRGLNFYVLFPLLAAIGFTFYYFSRYGNMRRGKLEALRKEFVTIFTFFGIFVNDGFTVYNALERVKEYASADFEPKLEALLRGIDADKTVTPYVEFATEFEDISVKEVMLSVYQMVDEGQGGVYIQQFQRLFGKLSDTRHALESSKRLSRLDTLSFLPLAGAGIAMLSLTLSVMEIMGGLMDVL